MRAIFGWTLVASMLLAGCSLIPEPTAREVAGPTDGYTPTGTFLKLNVKLEDGNITLLDFDRRDWHASKIAEMVDTKQITFVTAQGMPRIPGEYLAQSVSLPTSLAKLRYDDMGATAQQRMSMDAEYSRLLEQYVAQVTPPALPIAGLP